MAITLTDAYQYIGRSNYVSCPNGWKYYILIYAKTAPDDTAGTHTVTVKHIIACVNNSTFINWRTTGFAKVAGVTAFSWSNTDNPTASWDQSITEDGVTYKRHTVLKEGSAVVNTGFGAAKTVNIESSWVMEEESSDHGFLPYKGKYATANIEVILPMIEGASVPSLSASSAVMGSELTINTNRLSSSFTHTLYYTFGGEKTTIATGVGDSYQWTVPDLAAKCENAASGVCVITCDTYNGTTKIGSEDVTVTLTVPDATIPTLSTGSVNMGSSVTITTARKSSNFTHTLSYSFAGKTGTIGSDITDSKAWMIPYSLAKEIPTEISGVCTIICETYNGTALIGTKTADLTIIVPNNETTRPSISAAVSPVHSLPDVFGGLYIQGKTQVKAVINAASEYADILSYKLTVGNISKSSNTGEVTSDIIGESGSLTVKCEVFDTRGFGNAEEFIVLFQAYKRPAVIPLQEQNEIVCSRCDANGNISSSGNCLLIRAGRLYSPVIASSTQKNFCSLRYRYRLSADTDFTAWTTLIAKNDLSNNFFSGIVSGITLDAKTSYRFEIGVLDDAGGEEGSVRIAFDIPTDDVDFHLRENGHGVGFGKYSEIVNAVEIADEWEFYFHGMTLEEYIKAVISGT